MAKKLKFQAPTGMRDILPEEGEYFEKIYNVVKKNADFYGFQKIETPILEDYELFEKGTGSATDIVRKEMFILKTKGGNVLALRPEGTSPIIRAYFEQGMSSWPQPVKLWYWGPYFRYEHPQSGRYRQFWQFGFEILGEKEAVRDAQIIQVFYSVFKELKLKDIVIEMNSLGDSQCLPYYKKLLKNYMKHRESSLCRDCQKRMKENILRVLDCKEEKCQTIKAEAPQMLDHLCDECRSHFKFTLELLDELEIPYELNPYLVRGLDYYTRTVFEAVSYIKDSETGQTKRLEIGGGGRYDKLAKVLGGKEVPACGVAGGVERIIMLMKNQNIEVKQKTKSPAVFLAQIGNLAKRKSLKILEDFKKANIKVAETVGRDSLKAQLSRADRMGVSFVLILGQKEALEDSIIIRNMKNGNQEIVKINNLVEKIKKLLK